MPVRAKNLPLSELTDLLNPPAKLGLPDPELVRRIVVEEYEDWTGEESLSVYIVVADDAPEDERIGPMVWPVEDAVREAITTARETRFPYITVGTEGEFADRASENSFDDEA